MRRNGWFKSWLRLASTVTTSLVTSLPQISWKYILPRPSEPAVDVSTWWGALCYVLVEDQDPSKVPRSDRRLVRGDRIEWQDNFTSSSLHKSAPLFRISTLWSCPFLRRRFEESRLWRSSQKTLSCLTSTLSPPPAAPPHLQQLLNNFFSDESQIVKLDLLIELGEVCEKVGFLWADSKFEPWQFAYD